MLQNEVFLSTVINDPEFLEYLAANPEEARSLGLNPVRTAYGTQYFATTTLLALS